MLLVACGQDALPIPDMDVKPVCVEEVCGNDEDCLTRLYRRSYYSDGSNFEAEFCCWCQVHNYLGQNLEPHCGGCR